MVFDARASLSAGSCPASRGVVAHRACAGNPDQSILICSPVSSRSNSRLGASLATFGTVFFDKSFGKCFDLRFGFA